MFVHSDFCNYFQAVPPASSSGSSPRLVIVEETGSYNDDSSNEVSRTVEYLVKTASSMVSLSCDFAVERQWNEKRRKENRSQFSQEVVDKTLSAFKAAPTAITDSDVLDAVAAVSLCLC